MPKRTLIGAVVVLLLLACAAPSGGIPSPTPTVSMLPSTTGGPSTVSPSGNVPTPTPSPISLQTDRDFATSAKQLVGASDLIAVGVLRPHSSLFGQSSDGNFSHLAQDFLLERVIAGKASAGEMIPVKRTVRTSDGVPAVEFDAAPLTPGVRYLLFLQDAKGIYVTVGGPQGQFEVLDGALVAAAPRMPVVEEFTGLGVDAAAEKVGTLQ